MSSLKYACSLGPYQLSLRCPDCRTIIDCTQACCPSCGCYPLVTDATTLFSAAILSRGMLGLENSWPIGNVIRLPDSQHRIFEPLQQYLDRPDPSPYDVIDYLDRTGIQYEMKGESTDEATR